MTQEERLNRILSKFQNCLTSPSDLLGSAAPSILFYPMVKLLSHLLSCNPERMVSKTSIFVRRFVHPLLSLILPSFLEYKQIFESKNALLGIDAPDAPVPLPDRPVIWCPNHRFKDDVAASIGTAKHAYALLGSFPMFFNTLDGVGAYINGVVMCNRKVKNSRFASIEAAERVLNMGMDMLVFPEGVWNKTPEKLVLDLWPGVYRMAKQTGSKVVPIIHYLADPHKKYNGNVIHTVVADPISMDGLSEKEGLELLRDTMATWYFLMMDKYGQSTRQELLDEFETADDAWESYIAMHTGCVKYYDKEIELCADYRPKDIVRPESVWQSIADIKNIHVANADHVQYARRLVAREKRRDFQRRF